MQSVAISSVTEHRQLSMSAFSSVESSAADTTSRVSMLLKSGANVLSRQGQVTILMISKRRFRASEDLRERRSSSFDA